MGLWWLVDLVQCVIVVVVIDEVAMAQPHGDGGGGCGPWCCSGLCWLLVALVGNGDVGGDVARSSYL